MAKAGFRLNRRAVADFLKNDEGGKAAVRAAAQQVLEQVGDPEAFLEEYTTDRAVTAVMVPADKQAKHGIGTRAANSVASRR